MPHNVSTHAARCELCGRAVSNITVHHLVPRSQVARKERSTLPTAKLCAACHKQLHALFSNRDLKAKYSNIEELREAPEMQKFLIWVRKQDPNKRVKVRR
jgi:predicted HNH restriction endonuclease